ncbi:MAG: DUF3127 domain-containing protein [Myxococcota bacterium]|nr:DUF3127 domain-containing protein [Myxococcota bacterium]
MRLEARGRLHALFDAQQVTERFRKREFVIELAENPRYPQFVQFQLTGDRCEALDDFREGEEVRVEFSLRGREWKSPKGEIRYFNSLDVWVIERQADADAQAFGGPSEAASEPAGFMSDGPPPDDEIPF